MWFNQYVENKKTFVINVKDRLKDMFVQEMNSFFENSTKCLLYKYLPDTFDLQFYLRKSLPSLYTYLLSKFRLSSHELLIEKGRYNNTPRTDRICRNCNCNEVEAGYHFILVCLFYSQIRRTISRIIIGKDLQCLNYSSIIVSP